MSGPTRQRSFRERLHGIGIPWQGKKSKSYHTKDGQTLAEAETKPQFQDSRSCDPIPSCESSKDGTKKQDSDNEEPKKLDENPSEHKEIIHMEKKLLNRSFTQPKGTEEYRVKAADTLERIAARFETTPSELAKLNRLTARMIFPGQMLFVPEKKMVPCGAEDEGPTSEDSKDDGSVSETDNGDPERSGRLGVSNDGPGRRKASVTDALRIPFRRHSDRIQRFLKVKARHFTDGQGVVAGVLIITPNAVMFDPNVSDPLVIEHGIESYGVIAPLDMVMRTAIYFDIAHMKVKDAPETQINIPKPDIYFGKMSSSGADKNSNAEEPEDKQESVKEQETINSSKESPPEDQQIEAHDQQIATDDQQIAANDQQITANDQQITADDQQIAVDDQLIAQECPETAAASAADSSQQCPSTVKEDPEQRSESDEAEVLSREGSLDKEVSDAFANDSAKTRTSGSLSSPPPHQVAAESRRERMLKRLSYPMESITSYTQSSISRILSSSPKSFVDGLFVRSSEEDKGPILEAQEEEEGPVAEAQEKPPEDEAQPCKEPVPFGYKNHVDEKPEFFAVMDKLLKRTDAQEQEGPPLYLCLRMGHRKEKKLQLSTPILSYGKKKAKSEYWFSIPHNRVEDLYNFLQQWFPQLYGDVDDIDPEQQGFIPIDDSAEDEPEAQEEEEQDKEEEDGDAQKRSTPRSFLKLVEDHFGFRSISPTDWEVLSMTESDKFPFDDYEMPTPELLENSEILNEDRVKELAALLPPRAVGYPWTLIFSTANHGFNLKTLYRKMTDFDTPVLLAIEDTEGSVFGSLISCPLKKSDHFYGNGESFLYTFHPELKKFNWTGTNSYFAKGGSESIAIGAGDGQFGIWIDGDLNRGRSQKCITFDNEVLAKSEDFVIKSLEVWGFV